MEMQQQSIVVDVKRRLQMQHLVARLASQIPLLVPYLLDLSVSSTTDKLLTILVEILILMIGQFPTAIDSTYRSRVFHCVRRRFESVRGLVLFLRGLVAPGSATLSKAYRDWLFFDLLQDPDSIVHQLVGDSSLETPASTKRSGMGVVGLLKKAVRHYFLYMISFSFSILAQRIAC